MCYTYYLIMTHTSLAERILNVSDPHQPNAISTAYFELTGERSTDDAIIARLDRPKPKSKNDNNLYQLSPDDIERCIADAVIKYVFRENNPSRNTSMMSRWYLYEDLHRRYAQGQQHNPPEARRSLLLGALSAVSSKAFVALSEDVYGVPAEEAHIIDIAFGQRTRSFGTITQGNALEMPYRDESFTFINSNNLLNMIRGTDGQPISPDQRTETVQKLYTETFRVLQPGGHFFALEVTPGVTDDEDSECRKEHSIQLRSNFSTMVSDGLSDVGFEVQPPEISWMLSGDFLFNQMRQFDNYERIPFPRALLFAARKPE